MTNTIFDITPCTPDTTPVAPERMRWNALGGGTVLVEGRTA